jgi:hypothetical protein
MAIYVHVIYRHVVALHTTATPLSAVEAVPQAQAGLSAVGEDVRDEERQLVIGTLPELHYKIRFRNIGILFIDVHKTKNRNKQFE